LKIALASDHGGYALKESIKAYLSSKGYDIEDFGAYDVSIGGLSRYALRQRPGSG
jgi:ribose 5-phosphate isomerase B